MKPAFLGDSFDIVKQSMLQWLAPVGEWVTHPMFTESFSRDQTEEYKRLLGTPILSEDVLTKDSDRSLYLAPARVGDYNVFLDPDTGVRLQQTRGKKAPFYIFGSELVEVAGSRPLRLTLIFDQSVARGKEREQVKHKIDALAQHGIRAVAYISHSCFLLLGKDDELVDAALATLKNGSRLPGWRFLAQGA